MEIRAGAPSPARVISNYLRRPNGQHHNEHHSEETKYLRKIFRKVNIHKKCRSVKLTGISFICQGFMRY